MNMGFKASAPNNRPPRRASDTGGQVDLVVSCLYLNIVNYTHSVLQVYAGHFLASLPSPASSTQSAGVFLYTGMDRGIALAPEHFLGYPINLPSRTLVFEFKVVEGMSIKRFIAKPSPNHA